MHEIVVTNNDFSVAPAETGIVLAEDAVFVDSAEFSPDVRVDFDLLVKGKRVGHLGYYPPEEGKRSYPFWVARIEKDAKTESVRGYGMTPNDALKDAFNSGVRQLRNAINYAIKTKDLLRRERKHISIKPVRKGQA